MSENDFEQIGWVIPDAEESTFLGMDPETDPPTIARGTEDACPYLPVYVSRSERDRWNQGWLAPGPRAKPS